MRKKDSEWQQVSRHIDKFNSRYSTFYWSKEPGERQPTELSAAKLEMSGLYEIQLQGLTGATRRRQQEASNRVNPLMLQARGTLSHDGHTIRWH